MVQPISKNLWDPEQVPTQQLLLLIDRISQAIQQKHDELGPAGAEEAQKNQFGETALKGDVACEEVVLSILKDSGFQGVVISEEHGRVEMGSAHLFTAILDGIDGSHNYKGSWGSGRYGTMLGVFSGDNPSYSDYIFSLAHEPASNSSTFSIRAEGCFTCIANERSKCEVSTRKTLEPGVRICVDSYWELVRETFVEPLKEYNPECLMASCAHYVDVAKGDADFALECTRKKNLEIAVSFALITEAGGTMVTLDGESISDRHYFAFGQEEQIPIITAASPELAEELIKFLK